MVTLRNIEDTLRRVQSCVATCCPDDTARCRVSQLYHTLLDNTFIVLKFATVGGTVRYLHPVCSISH